MKKKKKNSPAEDFFDSIKNNPQEIIDWCQSEIEEYKKLIRLLEEGKKK